MQSSTPLASLARDPGGEKNNQRIPMRSCAHRDAFGTVTREEVVQDGVRDAALPLGQDVSNHLRALRPERLTPRDAQTVQHLVRLRLLTYGQIHRLVFPGTDPSFARRRIRALADQGWLTTWERPTRAGGHDRYALPTAEAIRHELASIPRDARWSPLVDCMLPRTKRAALHLAPGATPKWLAHQREVNHLVTRIATRPSRTILWASSWDAPFPSTLGMFTAPQPDYVLVEEGAGGAPRLVFGEHDRASEPVDRFVARKVALYTALATFPDACEQFFGVREFGVQVSVVDPLRHAPLSRLRALLEATRAHGGPDIFRFTLGGWLFGYPEAAIWCSTARAPIGDSPAWRDHANLTA